jgi:hypothetical protein
MRFNSPGKFNFPSGMNQQASHIWIHVLSRYADLIFSSGEISDQWSRAFKMFERACQSRGIEPYNCKSHSVAKSAKLREISSGLRRTVC